MDDLLGGARYLWQGPRNYVALDPGASLPTSSGCAAASAPSRTSTTSYDRPRDRGTPQARGRHRGDDDPLWYKDAVIYELQSAPFTTATATAWAISAA